MATMAPPPRVIMAGSAGATPHSATENIPTTTVVMAGGAGAKQYGVEKGIRLENISPATYAGTAKLFSDFIGGKGLCFGICSYAWCPTEVQEYSKLYEMHPDLRDTTVVAVREADGVVVGVLKMSVYGQPRSSEDEMIHAMTFGEAYIEHVAVSSEARGKGVGTRMLQWVEAKARERGATLLTLLVVNGNPAYRLYERAGLVAKPDGCVEGCYSSCLSACLVGLPHGRCGAKKMEKALR